MTCRGSSFLTYPESKDQSMYFKRPILLRAKRAGLGKAGIKTMIIYFLYSRNWVFHWVEEVKYYYLEILADLHEIKK